jgi:hypothetical protein
MSPSLVDATALPAGVYAVALREALAGFNDR